MEEVRWGLKLEELEQAQLRKIGALKAERQFWGLAAEKKERGASSPSKTVQQNIPFEENKVQRTELEGSLSLSRIFSVLSLSSLSLLCPLLEAFNQIEVLAQGNAYLNDLLIYLIFFSNEIDRETING